MTLVGFPFPDFLTGVQVEAKNKPMVISVSMLLLVSQNVVAKLKPSTIEPKGTSVLCGREWCDTTPGMDFRAQNALKTRQN